jgi:hypothetical protein
VVSSTVRSPRFRHKNPTSVPPPTTPASTHCLSHATPQAQGPSLLELSGFAFRLQARRSPWPNRVRHPADCWLTSRCSPPCLAATQLRSISRAGERLPGGDSNPFVSVPSRAHKRPSSCSAGRSRPARAHRRRGARSRSERGARSEEDDGSGSAPPRSRRSRVPADREVGRFEEGPWTGGSGRHGVPGIPPRLAPLSGTVCQASRLDAHLSRSGRAPARPGGHARRSAPQTWSEERGARRTTDRAAHRRDRDALASRPTGRSAASRKGRGRAAVGGTACQASRLDAHLSPARCARHPASTRTSPRSGRAPARPGGHARRSAPQTWSEERGARSEERGARSEERGARGRRIGQRTAAIATLSRPGRPGGRPLRGRAVDGRQWAARPVPPLAPLSRTLCPSRLDAHLSRSSPARPGGHARRERTAGV